MVEGSTRRGAPTDRIGAVTPSLASDRPTLFPTPDVPASLTRPWGLDPGLVFLNHGSYGACLREVMEAQSDVRARMERDPVRFFKVDLERLLDRVRDRIGAFLGCDAADVAPVANATIALCTIFRNALDRGGLRPGDEVLLTDHEYSSGFNELDRMCREGGFRVVRARVPFPIDRAERVTEAVLGAMTPRTRLVLVSHLTSATSVIFPVAPIVAECHRRGIDVIVDGAHTPGQIPVNIRSLAPTYYVGSFHKWLSAPKGTGFVYVRPDRQEGFRTVCLSSRATKVRPERALFLRDFDYMGTNDYTGILTIPATMDAMARLHPEGWAGLQRRNHDLIAEARRAVCRGLSIPEPCPESMLGSMASIILPEASPALAARTTLYDDPLQDALMENHRIQVPVWRLWDAPAANGTPASPGIRLLRISAQSYNTIEQYHYLAQALRVELSAEHPVRATG